MSGVSSGSGPIAHRTTIEHLEAVRLAEEQYDKEHPDEVEEKTETEKLLDKGKPNRFTFGRDVLLPILKIAGPVIVIIGAVLQSGSCGRNYSALSNGLARREWTPIPNDLLRRKGPFIYNSHR